MSQGCSSSRIWVFLTCVFLLTTLAGVGYVIWREVWLKRNTEEQVVARYPTHFRTPEQQRDFEFRYFNLTSRYLKVNTTVVARQTCTVNCFSNNEFEGALGLVTGPTQYHACCQSTASFSPEDYLTNMFGVLKKIAQFSGNKQFFKIETCSHVTNFGYGQCLQHQELVTAVTEDESVGDDDHDRFDVEWVFVPGCCKCLNV